MKRQLDLNMITSHTLKIGVLTSIAFIATGVILLFLRNGGLGHDLAYISSYSPTLTLNSSQVPITGIPNGLLSLDGVYYIVTGLWILIFTPISVVVIAIIDFLNEENRLYVVMSILVLFNIFFAMLVVPRLLG